MQDTPWALRELISHGVLALVGAVLALVAIRGVDVGTVLLFGLPVMFARVQEKKGLTERTRWAARSFLIAIGITSLLAAFPRLFPSLGGVAKDIGGYPDRVLSYYVGVYLAWAFGVLPITLFGASLRATRRGETPQFSRVTCYLGLMVAGVLWLALPGILANMGFWPVW